MPYRCATYFHYLRSGSWQVNIICLLQSIHAKYLLWLQFGSIFCSALSIRHPLQMWRVTHWCGFWMAVMPLEYRYMGEVFYPICASTARREFTVYGWHSCSIPHRPSETSCCPGVTIGCLWCCRVGLPSAGIFVWAPCKLFLLVASLFFSACTTWLLQRIWMDGCKLNGTLFSAFAFMNLLRFQYPTYQVWL